MRLFQLQTKLILANLAVPFSLIGTEGLRLGDDPPNPDVVPVRPLLPDWYGGIATKKTVGVCPWKENGVPFSLIGMEGWLGRLEPELVVGVWRELRDRFLKLDGLQEEVRGALEPHLAAYLRRIPAEADCPLSLVWVARQAAHPRSDLAAIC